MTEPDADLPLAGLKVLEFSHTIMGPCAGLLLADLGADVIKVEPAPDGDKTRFLFGFAAGFFATFNRNKRSLAVDLKRPEGQQLIHKLVLETDIVLDNYGPGTMEKLGCGWEQLSALNPRLLYLSLKGYLGGPWADRPALDEVVQFQSGLAYMTGPPGQPLRAGASIIDILGAVFGVSATLAALRERDRTGVGQRVGSSLFESAAFLMASHLVGGAVTGLEVPPMTARKGAWGIYDVFRCSDQSQLFIGVTSDSQWSRFCQVFSLSDLYADQRLVSNTQRTAERHWLLPELEKVMSGMTLATVMAKCQQAEVSWSPIGRPEDLLHNEQLLANGGMLATSLATAVNAHDDDCRRSQVPIPAMPLEFGSERDRLPLRRQPPELGEHTLEILVAAGCSPETLADLCRDKVIVSSSPTAS